MTSKLQRLIASVVLAIFCTQALALGVIAAGPRLFVTAGGGGGGGGAAPLLIATDFTAGPTTGGENNKGAYLTVYGYNLGTFSDYGTANHVTICGQEVDNYRSLQGVRSPYWAGKGVKALRVQIGSAGVQGLTNGTACAVSVTVGGTGPSNATSGGNYLDAFGEAITFTPQPGDILFVDAVSGNNANAGTFASPLKDLQTSAGTGGAFKIHPGANTSGGIKPGTHVYLRAGTYNTTGVNGRLIDLFRITGLAASGAADRGPIGLTSYPGAAGADSPETVTLSGSNINGNDSARAAESSTLYGGFTGWSQYIQISNLPISVDASQGSDHGPFNTQNHSQYWRLVNNEMQWPSTNSASQGRSAGIEGSPVNGRFLLNYIHNISGTGAEANTQHGVYMDGFGSGSGNVANGNIFAFNHIEDIRFGSGFQFYDGVNGAGMNSNTVAYNFVKDVVKHCFNIADNTKSIVVYNNIGVDCGEAAVRISTSGAVGTNAIVVTNNTIHGWGTVVSSRGAVSHESTSSGGTMRVENNIFMQSASHAANSYYFWAKNSTEISAVKNRWYDANGTLTTKPADDSTGSYGTPSFMDAANDNFYLSDGSACIDAGNTPTGVTRSYDFDLTPAPVGAAHDQGAFDRAA